MPKTHAKAAQPPAIPHSTPLLVHSIDGAARLLNISRPSLYKLIASGVLVSFKIGSRRLVTTDAITEAIRTLSKLT